MRSENHSSGDGRGRVWPGTLGSSRGGLTSSLGVSRPHAAPYGAPMSGKLEPPHASGPTGPYRAYRPPAHWPLARGALGHGPVALAGLVRYICALLHNQKNPPPISPLRAAVVGGLSAAFSRAAIHVLQNLLRSIDLHHSRTVHTEEDIRRAHEKIQSQNNQISKTIRKKTKIIQTQIQHIFRDVTNILVSPFLSWAILHYIYIYLTKPEVKFLSLTDQLFAGVVSGTVATLICFPLWTANRRSKQPISLLSLDTFLLVWQIARKEGVSQLFQGVMPELISTLDPALQLAVYDYLQRRPMRRSANSVLDLPYKNLSSSHLLTSFIFGAIAKLVATLICYPYLATQARLQIPSAIPYKDRGLASSIRSFSNIIERYGFAGLYKELRKVIVMLLLASGLMFSSKEMCLHICNVYDEIVEKYVKSSQIRGNPSIYTRALQLHD